MQTNTNTNQTQTLWDHFGHNVTVVESWGRRRYLILMDAGTWEGIPYRVNGDSLQDALDFIVDSDKLPVGCFADEQTTEAYWNESNPDHDYAQDYFSPLGNASELVLTLNCRVVAERQNPHNRHNCGY